MQKLIRVASQRSYTKRTKRSLGRSIDQVPGGGLCFGPLPLVPTVADCVPRPPLPSSACGNGPLPQPAGGGNSFSSGGPGKGMHSRLYTRVLNKYAWVHSCAAFNSTFNESGLVGIQAACEPDNVEAMLAVMCSELEAVEK